MINIFSYLRDKGYNVVQPPIYSAIEKWRSWYNGDVDKFHTYSVYNGQTKVECHRYSLGMAKKVCEDWANLLENEKTFITLDGEAEQAFFNAVCDANNFGVKISEMQELKSALGTAAYVPRVMGAEIDAETGEIGGNANGIKIDYITADRIFPLSWENRVVRECAFASKVTDGDEEYFYIQIHHIVNGTYHIENSLVRAKGFEEVDLTTVKGFESVPPSIDTGSNKPQFVIDRLNIVNNMDYTSPMGIAVYANCIDQLKSCDIIFDSYINEFVLGKKRIYVKPEATKNPQGEPYFDPRDVVFYVIPEDGDPTLLLKESDMSLRVAEHNTGIQDALNILSSKCGFGENYYRYDNGSVATATQIISENSTMYKTMVKHEKILESVFIELARIILRLGNAYMGAGLNENVEVTVKFDDSIIIDTEAARAQDRQDVAMGAMSLVEYRMKWYGEDEQTAMSKLPKMEELVSSENE